LPVTGDVSIDQRRTAAVATPRRPALSVAENELTSPSTRALTLPGVTAQFALRVLGDAGLVDGEVRLVGASSGNADGRGLHRLPQSG
jgi:hypothetical protein